MYSFGFYRKFRHEFVFFCEFFRRGIEFLSAEAEGNALLAECGAASMAIYVLHNFVISALRLIFRRLGLSISVNTVLLFVFCCIMGVIIPLVVTRLYRNVKCLHWVEFVFYPGKLIPKK